MNQDKFEMAALEILDDIISGGSLEDQSIENIRTLLAYEMWKDGMDWAEVEKFLQDKEWSREQMIEYLISVFDY